MPQTPGADMTVATTMSHQAGSHQAGSHRAGWAAWRATFAATCASLVGIGLARFAYTPLLPAIIAAHWFSASSAGYLGAANLAGYLLGGITARRLARVMTAPGALRAMMAATTLALFACAWPLNFTWFLAWRIVSGMGGGVMMVLAAPTVLPLVPPQHRGRAGGVIFAGVGLGVAASGLLVPGLLRLGLTTAWLALAGLSLVLTAAAWPNWPAALPPAGQVAPVTPARAGRALLALYAEYALNAFGLVPHMIFLVVFVASGLARGLAAGAACWVLFGLGATLGPVLTGAAADRIGFTLALRLAFLVQAAAALLPALSQNAVALAVSSVIMGAFTPGIVPLVLGRTQQMAGLDAAARQQAWSRATICFAGAQAAGGYGMSFLLARTGENYALLFYLAAAALLLALVVDVAAGKVSRHGVARARISA